MAHHPWELMHDNVCVLGISYGSKFIKYSNQNILENILYIINLQTYIVEYGNIHTELRILWLSKMQPALGY